MNHYIKKILLLASILVLLISACDAQSLDAAGTPEEKQPPGALIEPRPNPTPQGDVGDADQVITVENIQIAPIPPVPAEPFGDVNPEDIPSPEELSAVLDRVNQGGPERPGSDQVVVAGPSPGTESDMGPMSPKGTGGTLNPEGPDGAESAESIQIAPIQPVPAEPFGDVNPEDIPSPEELSAVLDRVNQGGPERSGSDETVGEGPDPGTESTVGAESNSNPAEEAGSHPWALFVEMLRNWLQEIFD